MQQQPALRNSPSGPVVFPKKNIKNITGTSYQVTIDDLKSVDLFCVVNRVGAFTLLLPDAGLQVGMSVDVVAISDAAITVNAGGGATLNGYNGATGDVGRYGLVTLTYVAVNQWLITGQVG